MNSFHPLHPRARTAAVKQRGVVLLFSLIALVIMLIAAVALVRSFQSSMFTAGNIAFKRDLQNQGERAVTKVLTEFRTGALNTPSVRADPVIAKNYSAVMLDVDTHGIPLALQNNTTFAAVGDTANDITPATDASLPANQIQSIRYVIDRLCSVVGDETTLGATSCVLANNPVPAGTSSSNLLSADRAPLCPTCVSASPQGVVYRLSVRVNGPRNTQSFFQSTFTVPSS
jgi:type IV pilus assembly protein PilX